MRRDYINSMKSDGLEEFLSACEALCNCKYIVSDSRISAILKAIADNKQLYSMFGAALYGFDYAVVLSECMNENGFCLPPDPKTSIAFVFRLLVDIDSGKASFQKLLETYFYNGSMNEAFARFCLEVIVPFANYTKAYFSEARGATPPVPDNMLQNTLKSDAAGCVGALAEIAGSAITNDFDRAEFIACLNGLDRALAGSDGENIISSFLGVKYAVAYFFKSSPNVTEIFKKLEYDVKHLAD